MSASKSGRMQAGSKVGQSVRCTDSRRLRAQAAHQVLVQPFRQEGHHRRKQAAERDQGLE